MLLAVCYAFKYEEEFVDKYSRIENLYSSVGKSTLTEMQIRTKLGEFLCKKFKSKECFCLF